MADVFDYLAWRGDLDFSVMPPNEGDRLILSMLSFMDFADIVSEGIGDREITLRDAVEIRYTLRRGGQDVGGGMVLPQ